MTQSKKHHYLPQFYLKGFTNERNQFFIYDKQKDEIRRSTPENSFFEKYRNTGSVKDEKSDLPEQMLAEFDRKAALILDLVRKSDINDDDILIPENLYRIRFFIASTFWRLPKNDPIRESIIDTYPFKNLGFGMFDKKTGERAVEIEEALKDIDIFRKIYTSILPFTSFKKQYKKENFNCWKLLHRTNPNHITGDNPIILKNDFKDFSSLQEELIMPLSSKKVIICTNKYIPRVFPSVFNLKMDLIILHQSDRYICSSNEEYLRIISGKVYKISKDKGWERKMIDDLFNYFY